MFENIKSWFNRKKVNKSAANNSLYSLVKQAREAPSYEKNELLDVYCKSPWLRGVTGKVSKSVANTKFNVKRGGIELKRHPAKKLFDNVNPSLMTSETLQVIQIWLDLVGEAYLVKERDNSGRVVELWVVLPTDVIEFPNKRHPEYFNVRAGDGKIMEVPTRDVIVFRDINPSSPYKRGSGRGYALGDEIDIDEYSTKHIKNFFYNRAVPDYLITGANDSSLSPQDTKRLESKWLQKNQGFMNSYKPYFLSKDVNVHKLSQSFDNMQLVALRKNERDSIIQTFGVPPEILGIIENSNRATIDAADYLYTKHVIKPRLNYIEKVLTNFLKMEFGDDIYLEFEDPTPQDLEYKKKVLETFPKAFTINEIREEAGMKKLQDDYGKSFYEPDNNTSEEGTDESESDKGGEKDAYTKTRNKRG